MTNSTDWMTISEVSDKIVELVAQARKEYGIPEGMKAAEACQRAKLQLSYAPLEAGTDGSFNTTGRSIVINSNVTWPPRIEFTIYHEILHYLLEKDANLLEYFIEKLDLRGRDLNRVTEACCNMGAAEFLIPRARVRETIRDMDFSIHLIEHLANAHGASLQASATQLATYAPEDCYVVICTYGPCTGGPFINCLSVEHAAKNAHMKYPWKRGTMIPEDHLLHKVWKEKRSRSGQADVVLSGTSRVPCVHCDATMIGDSRVGGILYVDPDVPRKSRGRFPK